MTTRPAPRATDVIAVEEDAFAAELADIDALIARSSRRLARQAPGHPPKNAGVTARPEHGPPVAGEQVAVAPMAIVAVTTANSCRVRSVLLA